MNFFQSRININYCFLFILAFLFIFVASTSSPLYKYNEWNDVNVYFTMGKGLFNGKILYKDLFDHKGPLLYVIYGLGYLISNTGFLGIYIIESIFLFVSLLFAYKLSLLFLTDKYALLATILLPYFILRFILQLGLGGSAEEFVSTFLIIALYLYCASFVSNNLKNKLSYMFFYGLLLMAVALIKFNLSVFFLILAFFIFIRSAIKKEYKNCIINTIAFFGGMITLALPFYIYFFVTDSLDDFKASYIQFNSEYASYLSSSFFEHIKFLCGTVKYNFNQGSIVFIFLIAGLLLFIKDKKYIPNKIGRYGLFFSFCMFYIITFIANRRYVYYMLPISTFSVFGCVYVAGFLKAKRIQLSGIIYLLVAILIIALGAFSGNKIVNELKHWKEPSSYEKIATEISREDKHPTLLLAGVDGITLGTSLYTKLNIIPDVKYFYYPHIGLNESPTIYNSQVEYIKSRKYKYLVVNCAIGWYENKLNRRKDIDKYYDLIAKYDLDLYGELFLFKLRSSDKK